MILVMPLPVSGSARSPAPWDRRWRKNTTGVKHPSV